MEDMGGHMLMICFMVVAYLLRNLFWIIPEHAVRRSVVSLYSND